jgi:hypothetical protein
MSQTFELVCHGTKQKIWIGQGWGEMSVFYSGMPDVMERLRRFFVATKGLPLVLLCTDTEEGDWCEYEEFEETNP